MNTTVTKLSIFVFLAAAMTTLPIGVTTTFAASNINNHHHIQLMSNDDSSARSFTHTPNSTGTVGSDDLGSFRSIQYAWDHPHHHHSSTTHHHHSSTNMIAHINGDNSNRTAGNDDLGSFRSIQYAWDHPRHHQQNDMIAGIN